MEVNKHIVSGKSFFKYESQNKHCLFRDLDSLEKVCDILKNQVQKIKFTLTTRKCCLFNN